jgi:hypothetical protein
MRNVLRRLWEALTTVARQRATQHLELELRELEALFGWAVCAPLIGLPVPAPALALRLLPLLEREISAFVARAGLGDDTLAFLAGHFDLG